MDKICTVTPGIRPKSSEILEELLHQGIIPAAGQRGSSAGEAFNIMVGMCTWYVHLVCAPGAHVGLEIKDNQKCKEIHINVSIHDCLLLDVPIGYSHEVLCDRSASEVKAACFLELHLCVCC